MTDPVLPQAAAPLIVVDGEEYKSLATADSQEYYRLKNKLGDKKCVHSNLVRQIHSLERQEAVLDAEITAMEKMTMDRVAEMGAALGVQQQEGWAFDPDKAVFFRRVK